MKIVNENYKNKIKNMLKVNKEIFIGIVLGIIVSATTINGATILFATEDVSYNDTKGTPLGASEMQDALDKLYEKAEEKCNGRDVVFINQDKSTKNPIKGSVFTLTGTTTYSKTLTRTATSDIKGIVEFKVPRGTYTIKQTSAADGYKLNNDVMKVTVK